MKKGTKTYVVTALVAASSFFGTAYAVQVDHTNTVVVPGSACSPSNGPGSASSDESTEYYRYNGPIVNMSATKWLYVTCPFTTSIPTNNGTSYLVKPKVWVTDNHPTLNIICRIYGVHSSGGSTGGTNNEQLSTGTGVQALNFSTGAQAYVGPNQYSTWGSYPWPYSSGGAISYMCSIPPKSSTGSNSASSINMMDW